MGTHGRLGQSSLVNMLAATDILRTILGGNFLDSHLDSDAMISAAVSHGVKIMQANNVLVPTEMLLVTKRGAHCKLPNP